VAKLTVDPDIHDVLWIGPQHPTIGNPVRHATELEYVRGGDGEKIRVKIKDPKDARQFDCFVDEVIVLMK
jgi:hypothetical protein